MDKVTIFVEGVNDELFLRQLIRKIYAIELGLINEVGGIIVMGGHNREHLFKSKFQQSARNIVFEDADLTKDNRGLDNVKLLLDTQKTKNEIIFDYFIFPNNQEQEGSLENILLNIVKSPKDEWLNCAKNYYECLAKNGKVYDKKTQWDIFTGDVIKDKNLNFADETTWFIDGNSYLQPLIDFLDKFFK